MTYLSTKKIKDTLNVDKGMDNLSKKNKDTNQ